MSKGLVKCRRAKGDTAFSESRKSLIDAMGQDLTGNLCRERFGELASIMSRLLWVKVRKIEKLMNI